MFVWFLFFLGEGFGRTGQFCVHKRSNEHVLPFSARSLSTEPKLQDSWKQVEVGEEVLKAK